MHASGMDEYSRLYFDTILSRWALLSAAPSDAAAAFTLARVNVGAVNVMSKKHLRDAGAVEQRFLLNLQAKSSRSLRMLQACTSAVVVHECVPIRPGAGTQFVGLAVTAR